MHDDEEFDEEPGWGYDSYPGLRQTLAPRYRVLSADAIESLADSAGLSADDLEFSLTKALGQVGRAVMSAAPAVLPVAGGVIGTAFGGPAGAMLGGALGKAAGGALAGGGAPRRARTPPARAPLATGSPAAAQLLQLINRPEVIQALISMALGAAGGRRVPVGPTPVPPGAFANLLGVLANQAAVEHHAVASEGDAGTPVYLLDDDGEFCVDPAVPEERAARLLELLSEAGWEDDGDEGVGDWPDDGFLAEDDEDDAWDRLELMEAISARSEG